MEGWQQYLFMLVGEEQVTILTVKINFIKERNDIYGTNQR